MEGIATQFGLHGALNASKMRLGQTSDKESGAGGRVGGTGGSHGQDQGEEKNKQRSNETKEEESTAKGGLLPGLNLPNISLPTITTSDEEKHVPGELIE